MGQSKKQKRNQKAIARQQGQSAAVAFRQEMHVQSSFAGPLPPPELLKQYDEIMPGLGDRIVSMAERQQTHRFELEGRAVKAEINRGYAGQVSAFLIAALGLGFATYGTYILDSS